MTGPIRERYLALIGFYRGKPLMVPTPELSISNNQVVNTASRNLRSSTDRQLVQLKVAIDYR